MITFLNLPESIFVRRVFSIFDEDVSLTYQLLRRRPWNGVCHMLGNEMGTCIYLRVLAPHTRTPPPSLLLTSVHLLHYYNRCHNSYRARCLIGRRTRWCECTHTHTHTHRVSPIHGPSCTKSLTLLHIASHPHRLCCLYTYPQHVLCSSLQDSGAIDFHEFVIALYNYCTMGKPGLTMFSFDLYDVDNSG